MKRLLWLAAAVLTMTACSGQGPESPTKLGGPVSRPPVPAADAALAARSQTYTRALGFAEQMNETGGDSGRPLFDGAALRRAGFEVPDDSVVYATVPGGANRQPLVAAVGPRRGARDLRGVTPPALDPLDFATGADARTQGAGRVLAEFDEFARSMYGASTGIMSRAGWGARARKGEAEAMRPTHVTVHHTDGNQTFTAEDTAREVKQIQYYHMYGRAAEGKDVWSDIGYHFLIDGAGRVVEGRPAETLGAHAGGANDKNIGISMMGDYNKLKPTDAQVRSLTRLVTFLAIKYRQNPTRDGFLEPHLHYGQTDCPGRNMMAILQELRDTAGVQTVELENRLRTAQPHKFVGYLTTDA